MHVATRQKRVKNNNNKNNNILTDKIWVLIYFCHIYIIYFHSFIYFLEIIFFKYFALIYQLSIQFHLFITSQHVCCTKKNNLLVWHFNIFFYLESCVEHCTYRIFHIFNWTKNNWKNKIFPIGWEKKYPKKTPGCGGGVEESLSFYWPSCSASFIRFSKWSSNTSQPRVFLK